MIKEFMPVGLEDVGAEGGFVIARASVFVRVLLSERAGGGRAGFLSLEGGYPLLHPHSGSHLLSTPQTLRVMDHLLRCFSNML